MTGVLNARVAGAVTQNVSVTVGSGSGVNGYHAGLTIGSASPSATLGATIANLVAPTAGSYDFDVAMSGTHAQTLFRSLLVRDGGGAFRSYTSASASFAVGGGVSSWRWGSGSSPVWAAGDVGEVHVVQFFR